MGLARIVPDTIYSGHDSWTLTYIARIWRPVTPSLCRHIRIVGAGAWSLLVYYRNGLAPTNLAACVGWVGVGNGDLKGPKQPRLKAWGPVSLREELRVCQIPLLRSSG